MSDTRLSRGQVDRAGKVLQADDAPPAARTEAHRVFAGWRAQHGVPLGAIGDLLRQRTGRVAADCIVAQRLKRFPSVEAKLRRFPHMRLSGMQDIGGCRAIVSSVGEVEKLHRLCREESPAHDLSFAKDYLAEPKSDGYRSVHLVYSYRSESEEDRRWNGRKIEIQIRTRRQHAWATAVEIVDVLQETRLKVGGAGNDDWKRFFALMATVHAIEEGLPVVPGTPSALEEIRAEVRKLADRLGVHQVLGGLVPATVRLVKGRGWVLLSLDTEARELRARRYPGLDLAQREYLRLEQENADNAAVQVCLVSTESAETLRRAYPNYFLEVRPFVESLRGFLDSTNGPRRPRGSRNASPGRRPG